MDSFIGDISEQDYDRWRVLDTNLKGTFLIPVSSILILHPIDRVERLWNSGGGGGAIINNTLDQSIISERGIIYNIGQSNYAASKGGVVGVSRLTRAALAKEMAFASGERVVLKGWLIRVNAILPHKLFIDSPMPDAVPQENRSRILE